jgi:hypothetical protein
MSGPCKQDPSTRFVEAFADQSGRMDVLGVAAVMVCRRSEENAADVGYYHTEMYYIDACDSAQTRPSTWA